MSFFKVNTNPEEVRDYTPSNYINTTGMYDVKIKAAIAKVNEKGARSVDLWVEANGQDQMIYGAFRLENNDGKPNLSAEIFNKFLICVGINDELGDPESTELPVGKNGAMEEVFILPELTDAEVTLKIQIEYYKYNEEIKTNRLVRNVFRTYDNASAAEIVNKAPKLIPSENQDTYLGRQFNKELDLPMKDKFREVTEEEVVAWKEAFKSGKAKEEAKEEKVSKPTFGKKFGKS